MSFKDFAKRLADAKDAFKEGREGRGDGMVPASIGKHIVRGHSVEFVVKDKTPVVYIKAVIVHSEVPSDVGLMIMDRHEILERKGTAKASGKPYHITVADCFAKICTVLQKLGYKTDQLEFAELEEVGEDIAKNQPACKITISENGDYKRIQWQKFVEDDELPMIEDVMESDDDDSDDDVEDSDDDSDDDSDEDSDDDDLDDDEDVEPVKGDTVTAQPKGTKVSGEYLITSVNKAKQTCTLSRVKDDREFKLQPWSVIA